MAWRTPARREPAADVPFPRAARRFAEVACPPVVRAGRRADEVLREYYLRGAADTPDEAEWRTEIGWPIFRADASSGRAGPGGTGG